MPLSMFYHLSKVVWFFATPSNLIPFLVLVGLALLAFTRFRRFALTLATGATLLLFACGLGPVANWAMLPLEQRFPVHLPTDRRIDGIIVLGGSVQAEESFAHDQLNVNEAGERVIAMADLARRYPAARILFSGGGGNLVYAGPAEADAVRRYATTMGMAPERIEFENQSRTTRENALFTRAIISPKPGERWLLVTSAWHMPRAVASFRAVGFDVVAYPVDFRTRGPRDARRLFAFNSSGLHRLDIAAKEWFGLIGYRLANYTPELLPQP